MPIWLGIFIGLVTFILGVIITGLSALSEMDKLKRQIYDLQKQLDAKEHFIKKYCVCNFMPKDKP